MASEVMRSPREAELDKKQRASLQQKTMQEARARQAAREALERQ